MNMEKRLLSSINLLDPISLNEMDTVQLMNRTDTKYYTNISNLHDLLDACKTNYKILEINGVRANSYSTDYFDTIDFKMYRNHHNRKLNRYKVRYREYIGSNLSFLEIKFKTNKGNTMKTRIKSCFKPLISNKNDIDFIKKSSNYNAEDLIHKLNNRFERITLVSLITRERVTIDFDLSFSSENKHVSLPNTMVIEVKRDQNSGKSELIKYLKSNRIRPNSFSKYCYGVALLFKPIKQNHFKQHLNNLTVQYGNFR